MTNQERYDQQARQIREERGAGHLGFLGEVEYYLVNGALYRAPRSNPVFPDGNRSGRWEAPAHMALARWEYLRDDYAQREEPCTSSAQ